MKISKKNLMAFVKNHAYGEEVLGKGTIRSQTINSVFVEFMFGERVGEIRMLRQEDDIIVDQIVINPSDCKTLVTMKYGIITEAFILYK